MKQCSVFTVLLLAVVVGSCGTTINRTSGGDQGITDPNQVGQLQISPLSGYYPEPIQVEVSSRTLGARIYCTQNGEDPTETSTLYEGPFQVSTSATLRCRGYKEGLTPSLIAQESYFIGREAASGNLRTAKIIINLEVDGVARIRVHDGIMNLLHESGNLPTNPNVDPNVDPNVQWWEFGQQIKNHAFWPFQPYGEEAGITCQVAGEPSSNCVSPPLNLQLPSIAAEPETQYLKNLSVSYEREPVRYDVASDQIIINDSRPGAGWYKFTFEYWYTKKSL